MIGAATEKDVPECRELMRRTFRGEAYVPRAVNPFYLAYDACDPWFKPEQYRLRRMRGKVVSALKVYVRELHHPDGPVPVTMIGGVCTDPAMRGRGLIKPLIADCLDYSREIGAKAQLIVTPRKGYYERHGYRHFPTPEWTGRLPEAPASVLKGARIDALMPDDAGWVTDLYNASMDGYGSVVRNEFYTRTWLLEMRLARQNLFGLKLLRRGKPAAYCFVWTELGDLRVAECAATGDPADCLALASALRIGSGRFLAAMPDRHPFLGAVRAAGGRPRRGTRERFMALSLDDTFPMPDDTFYWSMLDNV